jgi:hypothetical protein
MLNHATRKQSKQIYQHFRDHREWFPHIRKDYLERMIAAGNVIFQDGVIIIYKQYQRRNTIGTSKMPAEKGDIMLHQILNTDPKSGRAHKALQSFFQMSNAPVWLTVRKSNSHAIKFYLKNGMKKVGTTAWMNGEMPGVVFRYQQ